ncbi:MAG: phenylalanine--tRNA ligase subunit alpha [Myxococcales bacterium]|nr:phenylalanine--tRNA ligase subunit alpha [Myxococcales bacterium]
MDAKDAEDPDALAEFFERALDRIAGGYPRAFAEAADEHALRAENARFAGPSGELTRWMKRMPELPAERRRELGKRANELKQRLQQALSERIEGLQRAAREAELSGPHLDVSLPGRGQPIGRLHPLSQTRNELLRVFSAMGFDVADGPEVELHEYNFDRLGFPPDHPATDMQDTFFVDVAAGDANAGGAGVGAGDDGRASVLLRTHTSTVQIREMLRRKPPLAVVSAGATFRRDDDATHSPMFMQLEGFMVDEGVSFSQLKGVLTAFLRRIFGSDLPVRFRPSYFPFVEPGGEVDMGCTICRSYQGHDGSSCRVCKGSGWIEILGCGMVHPVVFEAVGYDPERYTGFAFGVGVDRITMLRHGISHVGLLYGNDPRFLEQF